MKKYILSLLLCALVLPYYVATAHVGEGPIPTLEIMTEEEAASYLEEDLSEEVLSEEEILQEDAEMQMMDQAALGIAINEASYLEETNQASLNVTIINDSDDFVSGLLATLNVYKGDELQEEGYILEGTEQIYRKSKEIEDLAPNQETTIDLLYDLPEGLETGTYYYKLAIADRDLKHTGAFLLREPIEVVGEGWYLGILDAAVRFKGELYPLFGGPPAKSEDPMTITIPVEERNSKLQEALEEKELYLQARVETLDGELIRELDRTMMEPVDGAVTYTVNPWDGLQTGSLHIILEVTDTEGKTVANDIYARWFRYERLARVTKIDTGTNYYKEGDTLDIDVTAVFTDFPEGEVLDVILTLQSGDKKHEFKKEYAYTYEDNDDVSFYFNDEVVSEDFIPEIVEAKIVDPNTGQVIDTYAVNTSGDVLYVNGEIWEAEAQTEATENEATGLFDYRAKIMLLIVVIVILLITALLFYLKKQPRDINRDISAVMLFLLFASFAMLSGASEALGHLSHSSSIWVGWSSRDYGNQGMCPKNTGIDNLYVYLSCGKCLNGMTAGVKFRAYKNGTQIKYRHYSEGFGHVYSWPSGSHAYYDPPGPYDFKFTIDDPSASYRYKADLYSTDGCHCYGAQHRYGLYPVSCTPNVSASLNANPSTIMEGATTTLTWTTNNTTSCTPSGGSGGWDSITTAAGGGSHTLVPTTDATYRIDCTNGTYPAADTVSVNVVKPLTVEVSTKNQDGTGGITFDIGDTIRWTATPNEGLPPYTYHWSGDITGTTPFIERLYGTVGNYTATVEVTDSFPGTPNTADDTHNITIEDNRQPQ